jgi:Calx-beta domain
MYGGRHRANRRLNGVRRLLVLGGVGCVAVAALVETSAGSAELRTVASASSIPTLGAALTGPGSLPTGASYCAADRRLTRVGVDGSRFWCTPTFRLTMSFPLAAEAQNSASVRLGLDLSRAPGPRPGGVVSDPEYLQPSWCGVDGTSGAGCGNVHADPNGQSAPLFISGLLGKPAYPVRVCSDGFLLQVPGGSSVYSTCTGLFGFSAATRRGSVPVISVGDKTVDTYLNGYQNATFRVRLSRASRTPVIVHYATHDGTGSNAATAANGDYNPAAGTLTFAPGEIAKTVKVTCHARVTFRDDGAFELVLSHPTGARFATSRSDLTVDETINPDLVVGTISYITGSLYVQPYGSTSRIPLKVGEPIYVGDELFLDTTSRAGITFVLGGRALATPNASWRVDDVRHLTPVPNHPFVFFLKQKISVIGQTAQQGTVRLFGTQGCCAMSRKG